MGVVLLTSIVVFTTVHRKVKNLFFDGQKNVSAFLSQLNTCAIVGLRKFLDQYINKKKPALKGAGLYVVKGKLCFYRIIAIASHHPAIRSVPSLRHNGI